MRIFLLVMGTRGDLEILLALGCELASRGHSVRLAASPFFEPRVRDAGLDWLPIGDGTLSDLKGLLADLELEPDPRRRVQRYFKDWVRPQLGRSAAAVNQAIAEADYHINNLKSVWTRDGQVIPGASVSYELPGSLENLAKHVPRRLPHRGLILQLVALPKELVDPDSSWGDDYVFTGFWESQAAPALAPALERFLAAGSPPVVMTMGSMVCPDMERWISTLTDALQRIGRRGVAVGGWSRLPRIGAVSEALFAVPEAAYELLFPRAACVLHHGGCGTVAAALRSGAVSVVMPRISSQTYFAELLGRRGLSAGTLDATKPDPLAMALAIQRALGEPELSRRAARWKVTLATASGTRAAGDAVEAHVRRVQRAAS